MYNPALEKRLFTREAPSNGRGLDSRSGAVNDAAEINKDLLMTTSKNHRFQKFEPRGENEENNKGLNFNDDF